MSGHRKTVAAFALGILTTLACGRRDATKSEIPIGEYSSMTGTTATFGQSTDQAIRMAVDEINQAGGVLGKSIRLYLEDDQSRPEEAATAATKLINQNHVVAILGEVSSSRSLAAAPICQANRVPMVSPSSTNPRVTQVGDYIFRVCFIDSWDVPGRKADQPPDVSFGRRRSADRPRDDGVSRDVRKNDTDLERVQTDPVLSSLGLHSRRERLRPKALTAIEPARWLSKRGL